jgi:hypothetical protein
MSSYCWITTSDRENTKAERRGVRTCAEGSVPLGPRCIQAAAAHHLSRDPVSRPSPPFQASSMSQLIGADITCGEVTATSSDCTAENDETVLVAALQEIEARRAAIEWLLEGNLLCLCLV